MPKSKCQIKLKIQRSKRDPPAFAVSSTLFRSRFGRASLDHPNRARRIRGARQGKLAAELLVSKDSRSPYEEFS